MNPIVLFWCAWIILGTFISWEFIAWSSHKYIMHGFLWVWHKSHHTVHHHRFEKNDLFALVFSLPSIILLFYFTQVEFNPYFISMGIGIFCYGLFYFIFHDVIVHQRIKWKPALQNKYIQRMIHAHFIHHRKHTKEGCEAFGFLWAPRKFAPEEIQKRSPEKVKAS
jgi:beta-carotene 3-hydroxylase